MEATLKQEDYVCSQSNCKFQVDGQCIDGFNPPKVCNFRKLASEVIQEKVEAKNPTETIPMVSIGKGRSLDFIKADEIMASENTKVILLAGLKSTGKSTLLGSLMQLFQDNPSFAGYYFAGSETLLDFEWICHLSRTKSGRAKGDTIRTVPDLGGLLHLKVKSLATSRKQSFLLANLSGEDFERISNSRKASEEFILAKRANHIALFLDSELLSNIETRQSAKVNSINVLEALLDADMISQNAKIEIVFSRWDLLLAKNNPESDELFIEQVKADIKRRIDKYHFDIDFFEIASRPENPESLEFGYGISKIFKRWTTVTEAYPNFKVSPKSTPKRAFTRF